MFIRDFYIHTFTFQILNILKCFKDPTCALFLKSMSFKGIKYDITIYQIQIHKDAITQIHKYKVLKFKRPNMQT